MNVHFLSKTDEYSTPGDFFKKYDKLYNFDLDVCASPNNAKCSRFFIESQNGLAQKWEGTCWMNPPYGREIKRWVKKAYEASLEGAVVVCLLPSRTDTTWWHDYVMKGDIEFIKGRLKFSDLKINAPFPSAVVVFKLEQTP